MKGISVFFLFSSSILFSQETGIVVDKIVAQIGDQIILKSDIETQKQQELQAGANALKINSCEILEQLMTSQLLLDQALLDSIVVSDEQVDAEMENRLRLLDEKFKGREKLEAFYGETTNQIKEKFRIQIRNKILSQEMERKLVQSVSVTPKDVNKFFKSIPTDSIPYINMKLSFQQIVHYPKITKEDKKRAYDILSDVRTAIVDNGKSFETQARIVSDDPGSASKGGKIEASAGMMVPQFESTVFQLKVGEISNIIETPYGYHIIKRISLAPAPTFEEMKATLESKVAKDERSKSTQDSFVAKLKKEYGYKDKTKNTLKWFVDHIDSNFYKGNMDISSLNTNSALFIMDGKEFKQQDFAKYIQSN